MEKHPRFSVIVPVYNRIDEVSDLMESLEAQTCRDFEVVIVEDGSTEPCEEAVRRHPGVRARYFYKENEGRSIARNYGMERAEGDYFIFFDSDCVIPPGYFETLSRELDSRPLDCFGGPDAAHESFSTTPKALNKSQKTLLTPRGRSGGQVSHEKFSPPTLNMGFSREVYDKVGGFREMFSEDIDMSMRIRGAGFSMGLIRPAYVYHKRRVDFRKFFRQVHVFGMSRITLKLLYPGSMKAVHTLPAIAVIMGVVLVLLGIFVSPWWLLPIGLYLLAIFVTALVLTRSLVIALKAVPASVIQICGYGTGFIKAYVTKILLGRGRDIQEEILIRKGK